MSKLPVRKLNPTVPSVINISPTCHQHLLSHLELWWYPQPQGAKGGLWEVQAGLLPSWAAGHKDTNGMTGEPQDRITWFKMPLCRGLAVFCIRTSCLSLAARIERNSPRSNHDIDAHG